MIQLNLLPDVKLDYIHAQRSRRLVLTVSVLVTAVAVAVLIILLGWDLGQKHTLGNLNKKITQESATLQQKPDITKILTVQNQLESLTNLHSTKPAASRLFDNYLNEITPASVAITDLHIDFTQQTVTITGSADALSSVNQYVDTLKFTTFSSDTTSTTNAFSDVVLTSFGLNTGTKDATQAANYEISLSYNPAIFDITQNVKLSIPNITTTRSQLDQPGDLFKVAPVTNKPQGSQ